MRPRKTPIDKAAARQLRATLYADIDRGEVNLQDAVKRMRKISRLSQPEFAAHLGVSAKVVKEIERGIGNPTVASLNRIGQFFGLEVAFVRSEKLRAQAGQVVTVMGEPAVASVQVDAPRSAVEEVRRMVDELEEIKKKVVPTKQLTATLKRIEKALRVISEARNIAEQGVPGGMDTELQAVRDAQKVIDSAEKIQRQLEPPAAVKQWLADIEAAHKLLNPFDDRSKRLTEK